MTADNKVQGKFFIKNEILLVQTNGEVNISHETTTMVLWIYDGI